MFKKIFVLFFVFSLFLFAEVGRIAVAKGGVTIVRGGYTIDATTNMELKEGDVIKTSETGKIQLILADKTVITIGKKSEFSIDNYFYSSNNKSSRSSFKLRKGIFKSITGGIGKLAPERFKINTRTSTIGIRGTQLIVTSDDFKDEIACIEGGLYVQANGDFFNIDAGNFMTIRNNISPDLPQKLTEEVLNNFRQALKVDSAKNTSDKKNGSSVGNKNNSKTSSSGNQKEQEQDKKQKSMDTQVGSLSMDNSGGMSSDFADVLQFQVDTNNQTDLQDKAESFGIDLNNKFDTINFREAFDPDANHF